MRKLVVLVFVVVIVAGVLSIVDVVVREGVQEAIADRIEARSPGSDAVVRISSFPFLGRLAVSGTVPSLQADVSDVKSGDIRFTRIDMRVYGLKIDKGRLLHGEVEPRSISSGRVVADLAEGSLDTIAHVPLTLGKGTVSVDGVSAVVHPVVVKDAIVVGLGHGLPSLTVPVPELDILPCIGTVRVVPAALELSCRFTTLPGILTGTTFHV